MATVWDCPNCRYCTYNPKDTKGYCPKCGKELEPIMVKDGTPDSDGKTKPY